MIKKRPPSVLDQAILAGDAQAVGVLFANKAWGTYPMTAAMVAKVLEAGIDQRSSALILTLPETARTNTLLEMTRMGWTSIHTMLVDALDAGDDVAAAVVGFFNTPHLTAQLITLGAGRLAQPILDRAPEQERTSVVLQAAAQCTDSTWDNWGGAGIDWATMAERIFDTIGARMAWEGGQVFLVHPGQMVSANVDHRRVSAGHVSVLDRVVERAVVAGHACAQDLQDFLAWAPADLTPRMTRWALRAEIAQATSDGRTGPAPRM